MGEKGQGAIEELRAAAKDPSPNVATVAGEALYKLGYVNEGRAALLEVLKMPNSFARTHALNAIDSIEDESRDTQQAVLDMIGMVGEINRQHYDLRAARGLLTKWDVDPTDHGFDLDW